MKKYTKGFTLIELLVVIAIIGILSSVVLVSLNTARNKGKDARVIASVNQMRTALESNYNGTEYTYLDLNGTSTVAAIGTDIDTLAKDVWAQGSTLVIRTDNAVATRYAIAGRLISNATLYFCLASDGTTNSATSSPVNPGGC